MPSPDEAALVGKMRLYRKSASRAEDEERHLPYELQLDLNQISTRLLLALSTPVFYDNTHIKSCSLLYHALKKSAALANSEKCPWAGVKSI